ncbi:DUF1642 domain-containing protein [Lacticaseibacillus paracasei]|uniref:DUF1642 domain-containing protein n=1 Tax=Lacticaseibacillus paracasei TaxID=1597 RepID=UPI0009A28B03|nr:DUF1642 domain-containing protein [Lacticaseibacillus paracasei]OPH01553.1 hypothetical protein B4586_13315 [Lacticaseibacillus paracasei]
MSEGKLYAVKNAKGLYLSMSADTLIRWREGQVTATTSQRIAHDLCTEHGDHVVTLIEEPKKVVLTKEQAKIVKYAHSGKSPASNIAFSGNNDEELLIKAFVNGYTVAEEKKYLVYKELGGKQKNKLFAQAYRSSIYPGTISWILTNEVKSGSWAQFTEAEIKHYGLQDCEKEEVTDDEQ